MNHLLFKIFPVKRRKDPSRPHHRLALVKFLLLAYRQMDRDGGTVSLHPLLDQLGSEPGLAASFGFANGAPSERWVVLVHRRLVDHWQTLQTVLPWQVCKPSRILDMHSDRSGLISRVKKLKAYDLEGAVQRMFPAAGKGPDPYERMPMVLALLASYDPDIKGVANMTALVDALREDASLREICGFTDLVPSRPTFVRALEVMESEGAWQILQEIKHQAVDERRAVEPRFGRCIAVDSTVVPAYCNPNRKTKRFRAEGCDPATCEWCRKCRGDPKRCACACSDPEASWIKKYDARARKGYIWVWGYKYHMLVDVETGNEIVGILTNGRTGDGPMLRALIRLAEARFPWFAPELLLADRGYDSRKNVKFLNERGIHTVIPKKELRKGWFHHKVYNYQGVPTCEHRNLMQYVRTDALTESYVYVRAEECDGLEDCLRSEADPMPLAYSVHGDEVWVDPRMDPWVFGYPYRHGSEEFDTLYLYRLAVERTFGEMKKPGRLTQFQFRGEARVRLHAMLCTVMEQVAIVVALDRRDEARQVARMALAA
ncbi:MAG: transposase [Rhodospirillaceae bacterium]|nr:transposase [Rhodospirillaceae bacterium]